MRIIHFGILVTLLSTVLLSCRIKDKRTYTIDGLIRLNVEIPPLSDTVNLQRFDSVYGTYNVDSFVLATTMSERKADAVWEAKLSSCSITITNADSSNNAQNFLLCNADVSTGDNNTVANVAAANVPDVYAPVISFTTTATENYKSYIYNSKTAGLSAALPYNCIISGRLRHPVTHPLHCILTATFTLRASYDRKYSTGLGTFQGHF